jgi:hypothetical protein
MVSRYVSDGQYFWSSPVVFPSFGPPPKKAFFLCKHIKDATSANSVRSINFDQFAPAGDRRWVDFETTFLLFTTDFVLKPYGSLSEALPLLDKLDHVCKAHVSKLYAWKLLS